MVTLARSRKTAGERREDVVQVAIDEFATYGYHGGSTERIAKEAGISQPYVQRLFGTKKALFLAALDRVCEDIVARWRQALEGRDRLASPATPQERLEALRGPFFRFVNEVVELRLILQASAAAEDEEIRARLKGNMGDMFAWVRQETGGSYEEVQMFWAHGMMLMIAASIGAMEEVPQAEWARAMLMLPDGAPLVAPGFVPAATDTPEGGAAT